MNSRRQFLQIAGLSLASLASRETALAKTVGPARSFEHGEPLEEFRYDQVQFAPGLQETQLEQTHSVLMSLNEDSLLRPYRLSANLPGPGCDLGGWYSSEEFEAETFGQWISALSRHYAITGDEPTQSRIDRLIREFSLTIEPTGRMYGKRPSAYLYDKLVCGLVDAHRFGRNSIALDVLTRLTAAAAPHLPGEATEEVGGESYTIPENQFIAWQCGGPTVHLEIAKQYLHHTFFAPLARGENVLPGRHAYSHVNALCSAAKAYLVLGDESYLRAARNGFTFVDAQSFVTGGWGPNETFIPSKGNSEHGIPAIQNLADSLTHTHSHFETPCGSYAHFKLTRYLLRITKNPVYGDSMERVMFNTVLGAKTLLRDGRAFYQSDYNSDGHKTYFDGYGGTIPSQWPCCSGTLPQVVADYRISTYFRDSAGVYVNLFIPSTLTWQQSGSEISLAQSGLYPLDDVVNLSVVTSTPREFALRLRIPAWAEHPSIRVNGRNTAVSAQPGTFAILNRRWQTGDRVDLELPHKLTLKAVDAPHPNTVAVVYGPLVLFAVTPETPQVTRQQLLAAVRLGSENAEWSVELSSGRLRLVPFWSIGNHDLYGMGTVGRYMTYLPVT
jgi:DUF1680 family protein